MNYAEARQLKDKSGWHFTVRNDDRIWPAPCCRTVVPATEEDLERLKWLGPDAPSLGDLIPGPAHDAHATREGAEECFREWRRRQPVDLGSAFGNWTADCEAPGCGRPTKNAARLQDLGGPRYWSLCPEHLNEETVAELVEASHYTRAAYS